MMNDKLENLVKIRQLKAEPASEEEIAGLQRSGTVRLADAKNKNLSIESGFDCRQAEVIDEYSSASFAWKRRESSLIGVTDAPATC